MEFARVDQIKSSLFGLGTEYNKLYTNEEVLCRLEDLQTAMAKGIFAIYHAEHFEAKDIQLHFSALAAEYCLEDIAEYHRLTHNLQKLGYTIGSLKKGLSGERRTQQALRLLSLDQNVELLFNLTLQENGSQAEYDAIVITPYGIFVIEAKNFRGTAYITQHGVLRRANDSGAIYNLGEKMNCKEYLLRSCLRDAGCVPYHGILLYVDDAAQLIDEYKQIPISCCNTIVSDIRSYNDGIELLSEEQIQAIKQTLLSHHTPSRFPCRIDCQQIIDDYAVLIAAIEEKQTLRIKLIAQIWVGIQQRYPMKSFFQIPHRISNQFGHTS